MVQQITGSVGFNGKNISSDVKIVQSLLNQWNPFAPLWSVSESGDVDQITLEAIVLFQASVVGMQQPDGRVDPHGASFRRLTLGPNAPVAPPSPPITGSVSTTVAKPAELRQEEWQYLLDFTNKHEYAVLNMYNTRGPEAPDVTIGIGHALQPHSGAQGPPTTSEATQWSVQLRLYDKNTNGPVTPDQVIADWNAAKDKRRTGHNLGDYANVTTTRMPRQVAIDDMAKILKVKLATVLTFPSNKSDLANFVNFPAAVKIFINSFSYGWIMGVTKKQNKSTSDGPENFSALREALRDGKYDVAAQKCRVDGWSDDKNTAHRRLLEFAQQSKVSGLDPTTIPPMY